MARLENRSRYFVTFKAREELTREFPCNALKHRSSPTATSCARKD